MVKLNRERLLKENNEKMIIEKFKPNNKVKCSACLEVYDKSIWEECPFCGSKLCKDYNIPKNFYYER